MAQSLSQRTFDSTTNRVLLLYSQFRPLLDSELDEQQLIKQFQRELLGAASFGSGPVCDAFQVLGGPVDNSITILPGYGYDRGVFLRLLSVTDITGLVTPGALRTDFIYLEWYYREVDSIEDPSIIDPLLGIETATRRILEISFAVSEGVPIPAPPAGRNRIRIAKIDRPTGNPTVDQSFITDERDRWKHTYVATGLRVTPPGAFVVDVSAGTYWAGATKVVFAGGSVAALPPSSTVYIYATDAGTVAFDSIPPFNDFQVLLAEVKTNALGVETITDARFCQPVHAAVERELADARGTLPSLEDFLQVEHNVDGTHDIGAMFAGGIDRENWRSLKPEATGPISLQVDVLPGRYTAPSGQKTNDYPGGLSPAFAAPSILTGTRIDLLLINENNFLETIQGVPSLVTPIVPTYPDDKLVIAEVSLIPPPAGSSLISDAEIRDVRPFLNIGFGAGNVTGAPEVYERITLPDPKYDSGSKTFTLDASFTVADHSLQVFRNGKLLYEGTDYAEIATNQVQLLFSPNLVGSNIFEFLVPKPDVGGGSAPSLYELQAGAASTPVLGSSRFTLVTGYYTPSASNPTINVYNNGKRLIPDVDFLQTSPNEIDLNGYLADPGDLYLFIVL